MPNADNALPFVETSVTKLIFSRMKVTHEECGITVISGPWGIGKTTSIDHFAADHPDECMIVKIEPVQSKKGAGPLPVLHQVAEAMVDRYAPNTYIGVSSPQWDVRRHISRILSNLPVPRGLARESRRFTFIFDEAQYLNRQAIEILRYWNDRDRNNFPFPVGLIFVGNNEFALEENIKGESVLSGAVRSRLMFEVPLAYTHVGDHDLVLFAQSRGLTDEDALKDFVEHFSDPRVKRDLRSADQLLGQFRRRAGNGPVTHQVVQSILNP